MLFCTHLLKTSEFFVFLFQVFMKSSSSRVKKDIKKSQTNNSRRLKALAVYDSEKEKTNGKGLRQIPAEFSVGKSTLSE